jgi:hypothetical protein
VIKSFVAMIPSFIATIATLTCATMSQMMNEPASGAMNEMNYKRGGNDKKINVGINC